ncbi:hypothetical protein MNBD_NITROSPINAE02-136 [hydrothermal vent metagenome]|uniref:Rubrerythrin diiron-binding domain-containing protein n=1 Tax=hydrothermal vent metagenome TaxID=652676 RepID=A0A3B1CCH1_9ZZZZ
MANDDRLVEEKLLEILEEAIVDEKASAGRYTHALELAREDESRELLKKLARDELEHERLLKERYHEIKKRLGLKIIKNK